MYMYMPVYFQLDCTVLVDYALGVTLMCSIISAVHTSV